MSLTNVADELRRRELELTPKGLRTKANLLVSARAVFEELGFLDARIGDITQRAGLGQASFYSYWISKEEIFAELILGLHGDLMESARLQRTDSPFEAIQKSNQRYLAVYQANAQLLAAWEQACTILPDFMELKSGLRQRSVDRVSRFVSDLQRVGAAHPHIDATCTAKALISMTNHSAYSGVALAQESEESFSRLMRTIDEMWVRALGLTQATPAEPTSTTPGQENHE